MKIYLISHERYGSDHFIAHVVVAHSKDEVHNMSKERHANEGSQVWDNAKIIVCGDYTGKRKRPFILLSKFLGE